MSKYLIGQISESKEFSNLRIITMDTVEEARSIYAREFGAVISHVLIKDTRPFIGCSNGEIKCYNDELPFKYYQIIKSWKSLDWFDERVGESKITRISGKAPEELVGYVLTKNKYDYEILIINIDLDFNAIIAKFEYDVNGNQPGVHIKLDTINLIEYTKEECQLFPKYCRYNLHKVAESLETTGEYKKHLTEQMLIQI